MKQILIALLLCLFQPVLLDKGKVVGNWKQEGTKTIKTFWT